MMKVIRYLNECITDDPKDTLQELREHLGIRFTHNERFPELYVLNYSQIDSPKNHPIVMECRSLVVEFVRPGEWKVVSRAFDRFFNLGERGITQDIEIDEMTAMEKLDGSLISLFYHENYGWLYRTKAMIMPIDATMESGVVWKDLIERAFGPLLNDGVPDHRISSRPECTYIMELTSPDNRVVTPYTEASMTLLSIRINDTGEYINQYSVGMIADYIGMRRPRTWTFSTADEIKSAVNDLPNLEEGMVLYDRNGLPRSKVKNSAYVAAHYMRGECNPTPRRIIRMICDNELDEFLTIFPEFHGLIDPYVKALNDMYAHASKVWVSVRDIEDQKERALAVRHYKVSGLLFNKFRGIPFDESFDHFLENAKVDIIQYYMENPNG